MGGWAELTEMRGLFQGTFILNHGVCGGLLGDNIRRVVAK